MAFLDKYSYDVLLNVAYELEIEVTSISTISELKEAIKSSEYCEEEIIEARAQDALDMIAEDFKRREREEKKRREREENEKKRIEHEMILNNMRLALEQEKSRKEAEEKEKEELRLLYLDIERYQRMRSARQTSKMSSQNTSYRSGVYGTQLQVSKDVDSGQTDHWVKKRRNQKIRCYRCAGNHLKKFCPYKNKKVDMDANECASLEDNFVKLEDASSEVILRGFEEKRNEVVSTVTRMQTDINLIDSQFPDNRDDTANQEGRCVICHQNESRILKRYEADVETEPCLENLFCEDVEEVTHEVKHSVFVVQLPIQEMPSDMENLPLDKNGQEGPSVSGPAFEAMNANMFGSRLTQGKTEVEEEAAGKALAQKSLREIESQLSELQEELDSEKQARAKAEKQRRDLNEELEALKKKLLDSEKSRAAQEDLLTKREQELAMLKKTLEDETAYHETQIGEIRQKQNAEIENLKEQLHLLEKTKTALEKVNSKLEVEKSELADEVNALSTSRQDSERKREQLELQLQDMAAKLSDLDKAKTDYAENAQKLQTELVTVSAQTEELEAGADIGKADTLESQLEESQDLAEETRQKLAFRPRFRQLESGKETRRDQLGEEELTKSPNETEIRDLSDSSESTDILINEDNHKLYNDELSAFRNRIRKKLCTNSCV